MNTRSLSRAVLLAAALLLSLSVCAQRTGGVELAELTITEVRRALLVGIRSTISRRPRRRR